MYCHPHIKALAAGTGRTVRAELLFQRGRIRTGWAMLAQTSMICASGCTARVAVRARRAPPIAISSKPASSCFRRRLVRVRYQTLNVEPDNDFFAIRLQSWLIRQSQATRDGVRYSMAQVQMLGIGQGM